MRAIQLLFGCKHRFGFPISRRGTGFVYQVCLDCGAEFEYDWQAMRRGSQVTPGAGKKPAVFFATKKVAAA